MYNGNIFIIYSISMGLNRRGRTALHLGNTPTSLPKPIIKTTVNTTKMLVDVLGTTANK